MKHVCMTCEKRAFERFKVHADEILHGSQMTRECASEPSAERKLELRLLFPQNAFHKNDTQGTGYRYELKGQPYARRSILVSIVSETGSPLQSRISRYYRKE